MDGVDVFSFATSIYDGVLLWLSVSSIFTFWLYLVSFIYFLAGDEGIGDFVFSIDGESSF